MRFSFPGKNWMRRSVSDIIEGHRKHPLTVELHVNSLPTQQQLAGITDKYVAEVRQRYAEAIEDSRREIRDAEDTEKAMRAAAAEATAAERAGSQLGPKERQKLRKAARKAADEYDSARRGTLAARARHKQVEPAHREEMAEARSRVAGVNTAWRQKLKEREGRRTAAPDLSFKPGRHSWSMNPPGGKRRKWEEED